MHAEGYKIVQLANGTYSVHSIAERETFHPVVGPVAEAEALYVRQLRLRERLERQTGEFVIWDVGLGAAANVLTVLRESKDISSELRIVSFDHKITPLEFAVTHSENLGYFSGYETSVKDLIKDGRTEFANGKQRVKWEFHLGDFPTLIHRTTSPLLASALPAPNAILFDAFSPAKNPAMWTLPLFTDLFSFLNPQTPCAMPTYSRATMLRVTLLLAGFFVGVGHATGEKEETTIAANTMDLIAEPLGKRWLERVRHSKSAEPMLTPVYEQKFISEESWSRLMNHLQFQ